MLERQGHEGCQRYLSFIRYPRGTIASAERLSAVPLENIMKKLALTIAALAIATPMMGAGVVFAQTTASDTPSSTTAKVENWTTEQWDAAKAEWAKDKTKWADCQQQSTDRKLADRKSWSFLYTCMTTSS